MQQPPDPARPHLMAGHGSTGSTQNASTTGSSTPPASFSSTTTPKKRSHNEMTGGDVQWTDWTNDVHMQDAPASDPVLTSTNNSAVVAPNANLHNANVPSMTLPGAAMVHNTTTMAPNPVITTQNSMTAIHDPVAGTSNPMMSNHNPVAATRNLFTTNDNQTVTTQPTSHLTRPSVAAQPRQRRRRLYRGPDRLSALPIELQNMIYEYILVGEPIEIRQHRYPKTFPRATRWREPALLLVSKQIRADASDLYYRSNPITVHLSSAEFPQACAWIASTVRARDRAEIHLKRFHFRVATPRWEDLQSLGSLAHLYHSQPSLELHTFPCPFIPNRGLGRTDPHTRPSATQRTESIFTMALDSCVHYQDALEQVVALGRRARHERWSAAELCIQLNAWQAAKKTSGHIRRLESVRDRKARAREQEARARRQEEAAARVRAQQRQTQIAIAEYLRLMREGKF